MMRRRATAIPVWLSEHLAHVPPDPDQVSADLEACGFAVARLGAGPAFGHFLLMCAEARPYLGRKLKSLSRRISKTLTGQPRSRFDPALVRLVLAQHFPIARMLASRRSYRSYLVGSRRADRWNELPVPGAAVTATGTRGGAESRG